MRIVKLAIFTIFTTAAAVISLTIVFILFPWHKALGLMLLQLYCLISLKILRVTIEHADSINIPDRKDKGIILVPNHVSLLDIILMSALYRTIYVSKEEVKHYPVIGLVATLIGVIFLKRDSPFDRHRVIREIARYSKGRVITIFPQGTTSEINDRLPFKEGIFKIVAINPDIVLLPVTIHYKEDKEIAWRGKQLLIDNLKAICSQKRIHVKITVHEWISIDDYKDKTFSDICSIAQEKVFSKLWIEY